MPVDDVTVELPSAERADAEAQVAPAKPVSGVKKGAAKPALPPPAPPKPVALIGKLEIVSLDQISGWAWDPNRPDEPIEVEILDGDEILLRVQANMVRPDLKAAGIGNGAHAFVVPGLRGLFGKSRHLIRVRRAMDGVDLTGSPEWLLNEAVGLDAASIAFIEGVVDAAVNSATSPQELDFTLSFLLQLVNAVANARADREYQLGSGVSDQLDQILAQAPISDWLYQLGEKLRREYRPIHIELDGEPDVSIVVPVYNKFSYTYNCIRSIADHLPKRRFEVIIADDCSTDETLLSGLVFSGAVRVMRHAKNLGFIRSCNAAAAQAKGRYLFFLNNDTLVREGWLDELVETFESVPNIGIAGSKLLFEDGSLQEAGGIIWRMGDGWNWGRGRDPKEPAFNYLRDADWVSGAALMIERKFFAELGGFDEHYVPAYYEDTDLAFRVRAAGKRVVVQPASEIVHLEGVTSGTDTSGTGVKRYQLVNHRKFYMRWRDTLAQHRLNAEHPELEAERLVTKRAYFIDDTVPTPDQDAGSNAALEHMKALMALGYKVTFLPADNMAQIDPYTRNLQKLGIECLYAPFYWSVEEVFRKTRQAPDLVYLHRFTNASKYANMVRRHFPKCRIVYNVADLHFLRLERQAEVEQSPELKRKAEEQRRAELAAMHEADCVLVHSSFEAELLGKTDPSVRVQVVPWTIHPKPVTRPFEQRSGIVFVGGYRHVPNVDAAEYLAREIMPLIHAAAPEIVASLVGSNMPPEVRALERADVRAIGHVPVLTEVLNRSRCTVVPLRYGAGIKGKVLESFAHGLPCVMTGMAAEGLALPSELAWLIANNPAEFAEKTVRLHRDQTLNTAISDAGVEFVRENFSSAAIVAGVERCLLDKRVGTS